MEIADAATHIAGRIMKTITWLANCDKLDPKYAAAYKKLYQLYKRSSDPIMDNALRAIRAKMAEAKMPDTTGDWMVQWIEETRLEIQDDRKKVAALCLAWLDEYGSRGPDNWQLGYQWNLAGKRLRELEEPKSMKVLDGWSGTMKEPNWQ